MGFIEKYFPLTVPFTPGSDFAGTVKKANAGVGSLSFQPERFWDAVQKESRGDRYYCHLPIGIVRTLSNDHPLG
jgi:NADPH:quinone reductase-like Zn-dependent oxidoreductase